jgi:hypothetical protein
MPAPRLHFAADLCAPILARRKCATTRLHGEADPNSDLTQLARGVVCTAVAHEPARPFAALRIDRVERRTLNEIDDALAAAEGLGGGGEELRALLLRFYPSIGATTELDVFHYTLLPDPPPPPPPQCTAAVAGRQVRAASYLERMPKNLSATVLMCAPRHMLSSTLLPPPHPTTPPHTHAQTNCGCSCLTIAPYPRRSRWADECADDAFPDEWATETGATTWVTGANTVEIMHRFPAADTESAAPEEAVKTQHESDWQTSETRVVVRRAWASGHSSR